jgi:hypothetical protein
VLDLDPPANDVTLPYGRLLALIRPWRDGWAGSLDLPGKPDFAGYPSAAWFWDTTSYMGLIPAVVIVWLLIRLILRRRPPVWPWNFLAALGAGALLLALPAGKFLHIFVPVAVLRSPARLLYLSTFAASLALGVGVDVFLKTAFLPRNLTRAAVAASLLFHAVDLGGFARTFVRTGPWSDVVAPPSFADKIVNEAKDKRVAGNDFNVWCQERYDDPGGFDSLILAKPYRALLALNGANPRNNEEELDSSRFSLAALQTTGVGLVIADRPRPDLDRVADDGDYVLYRVPDPAPRASFTQSSGKAVYSRPSSDRIQVDTTAGQPGIIRVIEAWDPGWSATVDGMPAPIIADSGFALGVPISGGKHTVNLVYRTPGRASGWILSLLDIALAAVLIKKS